MSETKEKKEWTVMIYMAGDNNLSDECVWAIKEMFRVGVRPESRVAVVVQYDPRARGAGVTRFDIGKASQLPEGAKSSAAQQVSPYGGSFTDGNLNNLGDSKKHEGRDVSANKLVRFLTDVIQQYPAKRYAVVLSGHGSGAVGKNFLVEGDEQGYLSIRRLRWALGEVAQVIAGDARLTNDAGGKFDLLGFDACAMSMVEVAYEMRDVAQYMIGAEGFEMNTGWPYHRILEAICASPPKSPEQLAQDSVASHVTYYLDYAVAGVSADQAVCDLSRMEPLAEAIKALGVILQSALLRDAPQRAALVDALILAHWRAQSYKFEEYVDLWDFCALLAEGCPDEEVRRACHKVQALISRDGLSDEAAAGVDQPPVVLRSCYSGATYQYSHGLSIYFPWAGVSSDYLKEITFPEKTGWNNFLTEYVLKTSRPPRPPRKAPGDFRRIAGLGESGEEIRHGDPINKMGVVISPQVKNPPDGFFVDDCATYQPEPQ